MGRGGWGGEEEGGSPMNGFSCRNLRALKLGDRAYCLKKTVSLQL